MTRFLLLILVVLLGSAPFCRAKKPSVRIAFYNAESLYDTVSTRGSADRAWTPQGERQWNTERYRTKIEHIARVIDDLDADLIAVAEVENENVVRDLMFAMRSDYNYIHRNARDRRGMDIVLVYKGSLFFPRRARLHAGPGLPRELLVVEGELDGTPLTLIACHLPSLLNRAADRRRALSSLRATADSVREAHPENALVVLGDFNAAPDAPDPVRILSIAPCPPQGRKRPQQTSETLLSPFFALSRRGYGSYVYRDRRSLYDHILLSPHLVAEGSKLRYGGSCGIFVRDYMIHREGRSAGYPLRTFRGRTYLGGYSDHLPVFVDLEKQESE
ncbi:endonuclease/exonuclease/phosphatase family protein [uncultured Alistipes sp.]|uniref:endonuclease/exonuclease/phosphatase family protein n=1 Tax=uncultured Alistipes sp. TaxID=538949 RepID=UPI00260BE500|nr:endonuclease/exonuclease/phosphatase family protein [uncultured Alistipes sp.]